MAQDYVAIIVLKYTLSDLNCLVFKRGLILNAGWLILNKSLKKAMKYRKILKKE